MKVIRAYPPNWVEIAKVFPFIKGRQGILYSYGDRLYNPSGVRVEPWISAHEDVHGLRQLDTKDPAGRRSPVEEWWDKYLHYPTFRYHEEVLAHQAEYKTYHHFMGQKASHSYLDLMAKRLSSKLYGSVVSYDRALSDIVE